MKSIVPGGNPGHETGHHFDLDMRMNGSVISARAVELARMVLRENAIRLYGFEAL